MFPVALVVAVAALAVCGDGGISDVAGAPMTPSGLLSNAAAAMLAKGSVRLDCSTFSSIEDATTTQDVGPISGQIAAKYDITGTYDVILIDGVLYLNVSNEEELAQSGVQTTQAEKAAGRWISFSPGNSIGNLQYETLAQDGLTLGDVSRQLQMTAPLKEGPARMIDGQQVISVSGGQIYSLGQSTSGQETVYISTSRDPLPVSISMHTPVFVQTCTFSRWGESVRPTAPSHPLSAATLSRDGASG
jgi:hypothetical protein